MIRKYHNYKPQTTPWPLKPLNYFFVLQCNEYVEMNKLLCSLACTWMTIVDSQFYNIDSLSLDVHSNEMLTWWMPGCKLSSDR